MQELLYLNSCTVRILYIYIIGEFFGCFLFIIQIACCIFFREWVVQE